MVTTVALVGVMVLVAYTVGYLAGRAEMDRTWRWRARYQRMGQQMRQADMDRPGNPWMN